MYENIFYKKPFLKEVILRVDFPSPIEGIESNLPQAISKVALKNFPISESRKLHSQELQITGPSIQTKATEITQWVFHGKQREKQLIIEPTAITFFNKGYISFELFIEETRGIIGEFYKKYKELSSSRVGLRYINILDSDEKNPLDWSNFINKDLLGIIQFYGDQNSLTRSFHILEFNFAGQALKFQFGIANPDYPAVVRRKQFVLDLDSYFYGAIEEKEIYDCAQKAHEKIQDIYEKSITDKTRQLMKQKND